MTKLNLVADLLWVIFAGFLAYFALKFDARPFASVAIDRVMQVALFIVPTGVAIGFAKQSIKDLATLLREGANGYR
ncbi:MAG TPA: hypothetical protein VMV71_01965 [Candidatus Paceibacterota bacterium]|nr:hypothetical protein [Candidatus Paceibacterota bacterium]